MKLNRENLQKHADGLLNLKSKTEFNMSNWFTEFAIIDDNIEINNAFVHKEIDKNSYKCGTTACALGFAPFTLDIPKKKSEYWDDYCFRVFGIKYNDGDDDYMDSYSKRVFNFLFAHNWPNCPKQAAYRIKYLLKHGVEKAIDLYHKSIEFKGLTFNEEGDIS